MKFTRIAGLELGQDLQKAWSVLQESNTELDSAFFSFQFTRSVAEVRPNVEIAIVEDFEQDCWLFSL